jgi:CRISPR-associated protein Cas2
MQCIVVYDIEKNSVRDRVADVCLDYGLERIQFSAFFGDLSVSRQKEVLTKIKKKVGTNSANVQIFPVCDKCLQSRHELCVNGYKLGQSTKKKS